MNERTMTIKEKAQKIARSLKKENPDYYYLKELYKNLAELNNVTATDYYVESFNTALEMLDVEPITIETADSWINSEKLITAKANNSRFSEWFDNNHYKKYL